MILAPVIWAELPGVDRTRRSGAVRGRRRPHGRKRAFAQPLMATAAVVRYKEQQDRLPANSIFLGASGARRQLKAAGGVRDQSRMAATRFEARGNAREPDGGTPGRTSTTDNH
jgi:hypothetical protein